MNLSYFRTSTRSLKDTVSTLKSHAEKAGFTITGEMALPDDAGTMVVLCKPQWAKTILDADPTVVGFLPCGISVYRKGDQVMIGTGQPAVIKAISQNTDIQTVASQAEEAIHDLIHKAAGVGKLVPKDVVLYSTMSCPYCKMEKAWLDEHKIAHDVVYVDLNREAAETMVKKTGQMGVPVTEIKYEDAESQFIIGFDKPQLSQILSISG